MSRSTFERTVALRFLRGSAGGGFLRFVTFAAIGGVAVGTGALLLALSIVRGFSAEIEDKVVGFGQHVQVESYLGDPLDDAAALQQRLAAYDGVASVTPAVIDFGLLSGRGESGRTIEGALVWGTPPGGQPFVEERVTEGTFSFAPDSAGHVGLVVGDGLARRLGLSLGSTVTAFSTRGLEAGRLSGRPTLRQFYVAGLFDTGLADFDDRFAYTDLDAARKFFGYTDDQVGRFDLVLDDIDASPALAARITEEVGPPVFARSVFDVFRHLFAWVRLQQNIIPLVISVLVIVAAFNIIGTLLMMILDKTREIGILLGMGASRQTVRRLFVWLGFLIGVIGSLLGAGAALAFAALQIRYGIIRLPEEAYYIDTAPVELSAPDFVLVPLLAIVLCTLAAYLPARAAARIEPIRSIRFGA